MAKSKDTLKIRRERRTNHELHFRRAHSIASIASADKEFLGCIELTAIIWALQTLVLFVVRFMHLLIHSLAGFLFPAITKLFMFLITLSIWTMKRVLRVLKLLTMTITSSFFYCLSYSLSYCPYIIALYAYISSLPLPMPRAHALIHYFLTASCKQIVTSTLFLALTAPANHIAASSKRSSHASLGLLPYSSTLPFAIELVLTVDFVL